MTASLYDIKTKNSNNLTIFVAGLVGAAIGVATTVGVAGGSLVNGATSTGLRSISARPTDYNGSGSGIWYNGQYYSSLGEVCAVPSAAPAPMPSAGAGGGAVQPAVVNAPEAGMGGGGNQVPGSSSQVTVIKKIIGATKNNTSVSLENTGPYSKNEVTTVNKTTTTVQNKNDVDVTNTNTQNAYSGDAKVIDNTNAGSANSGEAYNTDTTSTNVNISN